MEDNVGLLLKISKLICNIQDYLIIGVFKGLVLSKNKLN